MLGRGIEHLLLLRKKHKKIAQEIGRSDPQKQVFDPSDPKLTQNVKLPHFKTGRKVRKIPVFISNTGYFLGSPCVVVMDSL